MVFKRGVAELTLEERNGPQCQAMIRGKIISNYVFSRTKYICGGCGEVIPRSEEIASHVKNCAAIAEIESGVVVENSLFAPPEGKTHVESTMLLYKVDPWAHYVPQPSVKEPRKKTNDAGEEPKKVRREKTAEEGTGPNHRETEEERSLPGRTSDAGSPALFSTTEASAALLLLNGSSGSTGGGQIPSGQALEGEGRRK